MKTATCDRPAARRLLAVGITASTLQLVRCLHSGGGSAQLQQLMAERRRLLHELQATPAAAWSGRVAALRAAVTESDRAIEELAS